jgi:hypothetical protein
MKDITSEASAIDAKQYLRTRYEVIDIAFVDKSVFFLRAETSPGNESSLHEAFKVRPFKWNCKNSVTYTRQGNDFAFAFEAIEETSAETSWIQRCELFCHDLLGKFQSLKIIIEIIWPTTVGTMDA